MRCSAGGLARALLPLPIYLALAWRAEAADPPAQSSRPVTSPPPASAQPATNPPPPASPPADRAALVPPRAAAPAPAAPAPEDDLFEFLGTVDMDDAGLVNYLAQPTPPGARPGVAPKKAGASPDDKS